MKSIGQTLHDLEEDAEILAQDLEFFLMARCEEFLHSRQEHGFSPSTYEPLVGVVLEIIDSDRFGASAYVDEFGRDRVEVRRGSIRFLLWLSLKVACLADIPLGGGRPASSLKRRSYIGTGSASLMGSYDVPSEPLRRALAVELAFTAFQLIVFHEVGHLAQGHCRYLRKATRFDDYCADADDDGRQPLEFMADLFALRELDVFNISFRGELGAYDPTPEMSVLEQAARYVRTDSVFSSWFVFAVVTLTFQLTSNASTQHPPPAVRFLSSLLVGKGLLFQKDDEFTLRAALEFTRIVAAAHDASSPIASPVHDLAEVLISEDGADKVRRYIDRMLADFAMIEPLLRPLSRAPKAFPKIAPHGIWS